MNPHATGQLTLNASDFAALVEQREFPCRRTDDGRWVDAKTGSTVDDTKMNWFLGGLVAVSASGKLVARASAEQAATSMLAAAASLAADATPL